MSGCRSLIWHKIKNQDDVTLITRPRRFGKTLADTVMAAFRQIEEIACDTEPTAHGISGERIRHYGFVFARKTVLIG